MLGRYRLLDRLGSGGFGVVWCAYDEHLQRHVALKRVPLGVGGVQIDRERAAREAQATARLQHPAIVTLLDAQAQDDAFYLSSELVDGDTLASLIADDALADEEILEIGAALASALMHAHARGVIHRDIKPPNVLVPHPPVDGEQAPQNRIAAKLTDFGGASLVGEDALTHTGDVLGTLAYMSPEQSEGRDAGPQSDLYSLALVIYEALSGVNPVRGASPAATARRIGQPLPALQRARRDLPGAITAALDRALAPAPERRGTLEELHDVFEHTLERGLRRRRWPTERQPAVRASPSPRARAHPIAPRHPLARQQLVASPALGNPALGNPALGNPGQGDPALGYAARGEHVPAAPTSVPREPRLALPRALWLAGALTLAAWQTAAGRPGAALVALAALVPALALSGRRSGVGWLSCALTPALGSIGLAAAFPALAGQASRWRERAALGATGFWWLRLAEPLLGARLWLAPAHPTPPHAAWEASVSLSATHVIGPLLTSGVLLGALLWATAATALPWLVRGRSAVRDAIAVTVWAAALTAATPAFDAGLAAHTAHPYPRGLVLGAILAGLVAVAARALRGPV